MDERQLGQLVVWLADSNNRLFRQFFASLLAGALMIAGLSVFRTGPEQDLFVPGMHTADRWLRLLPLLGGGVVFALIFTFLAKQSNALSADRVLLADAISMKSTRDLIGFTQSLPQGIRRIGVYVLWARAAYRRDPMARAFLKGTTWDDQSDLGGWPFDRVVEHVQAEPNVRQVKTVGSVIAVAMMTGALLVPLIVAASQFPHYLAVIDGKEAYHALPDWVRLVAIGSMWTLLIGGAIATLVYAARNSPPWKKGPRPTFDELLDRWLDRDPYAKDTMRLRLRHPKESDPNLLAARERLDAVAPEPITRWADFWPLVRTSDRRPHGIPRGRRVMEFL